MNLHVLQLGPYPPPEGGVTRNLLAIRDELIGRGDKCSIIATTRSTVVQDELGVHHPRSSTEILSLLRSIDFDVLHLHVGGDVTRRVLALAFAATHYAGKRSVLTLHSGAYPLTKATKNAKPMSLSGIVYRRFGKIIAVNDALTDVFERFGVEPQNINKILPFTPRQPDIDIEIPEDLKNSFARHSPVLLSVGGLESDYDPMFQIAAMDSVIAQFPNAALIMVGDGSMRSDVEAAALASNHNENIYLPGNVDHAVTLHLINDADVVLRTSLFDGDAISIREALFLGTPVVATENGMRPDGVHLFEKKDISGFIKALNSSFVDGKQENRIGLPAEDGIRSVVSLYEEIAASRS